MNYLHSLPKCEYGKKIPCVECLITNPNCKFQKIIIDASIIISYYGEEINSEKAQKIILNHRRKYRLLYTHTILSEIILGLKKLDKDNKMEIINNFLKESENFEIIEEPFDKRFFDICNEIERLKITYSKNRDLKMCCISLYYNYAISTFDESLHKDIGNINNNIEKINKKLDLKLKEIKVHKPAVA